MEQWLWLLVPESGGRAGKPAPLSRGRAGKPPPAVVSPKRLSLAEARLDALDPAERAEFVRLKTYGKYEIFVQGFPRDPNYGRYHELAEKADSRLRDRLRSGAWLGIGRDPLQPHVVFAVGAERFGHLQFDFDKSALQGDGVRIIEVSVSTVGAIRLFKSSKEARLGALYLDLSEKSFDLLLLLAEAAKRGDPLVPNRVLKERLYPDANDKALGQGVADLWKHLERSGMSRESARGLVVNAFRRGYFVNLPGVEVIVEG
jgi:hypothetical protein